MKPQLIIEQKITPFVNRYAVYKTDNAGAKGEMVALAQQKRLALKELVTFYAGEGSDSVVFTFRAEKVMDIRGRYFVEDAAGKPIGAFKKDFAQSLVSSTWNILDIGGNPSLRVTESNTLLAVMRRYGGFIPFVGPLFELATDFLKYHFNFIEISSGQTVGIYQKTTLFRDHYTLHMTDEAFAAHDWRLLAAQAVALDALQSR